MPNQSVNFPLLGNTRIDTSEFWCEQSHVNFYGGFFPGKKITYSGKKMLQIYEPN